MHAEVNMMVYLLVVPCDTYIHLGTHTEMYLEKKGTLALSGVLGL